MPREELLDPDLPDQIATEITALETELVGLMIRLARSVWDRKDAAAVDTITICIVDLPTAILLRRDRLHSQTAREQLRAAVRAVLHVGPPFANPEGNPMTISLDYDEKIAILDLGDDENRFSPGFLDDIDTHLDDIEASGAHAWSRPAAGKFYTNGLDLDWLGAHGEQTQWYVGPRPGTAGAGAHPAHSHRRGDRRPRVRSRGNVGLAHDFRVMRADRGYFCFPEADINIPFTPGMAAMIQAKLTPHAAVASMTTGRRFGGADAAGIGIVDATAGDGAVTAAAVEMLRPLGGKNPGTLGAIKQTMFAHAVGGLTAAS